MTEPAAGESAALLQLFVDEAARWLEAGGDDGDARQSLGQIALLLEGEPIGAAVAAAVAALGRDGDRARIAALIEDARARLADRGAPGDGEAGVVAATHDESFNTSEYRSLRTLFREEAREALEAIARRLLAAARAPERRELDDILRRAHSLKGAAGTVGLLGFADAMHRLESAFERVRRDPRAWSPAVRDGLVEAVDALRAEVERGEEADDETPVRLHGFPEIDDDAPTDAVPLDAAPAAPLEIGAAPARTPSGGGGGPRPDPAFLRVEPARIDRLMDSVGELVFDRTRIERRASELAGVLGDLERLRGALGAALEAAGADERARAHHAELGEKLALARRAIAELGADTEALRRTAVALQDGLTSVRMESARGLYQRLAPQLRAIARTAGKRVELITTGGETEFDKAVADEIVDPIIHLLRNAVAHGIEAPEARARAGKPIEGFVTVSARHEAGGLVVEVSDDGAGIDAEALRRRLVSAGRWSEAQAAAAGEQEVLRALFDARLSSREHADGLAGRGIGLDAVREAIARLGGELAVRTAPGQGTTFTMRLPLTTAVSNALLFKVAGQVYAVPNVHVLETVQVETSHPALPSLLRVRDEAVPLVGLHGVLGVAVPDVRTVPAVVIEYVGRRLAMTCDKIVGPREIVVKNLGPLLAPLSLFAGGTISGSGKVQLILDPSALARIAYPDRRPAAAGPARRGGRILLADDSRSVRESVRRVLEQAGYAVDAVEDGEAAWRRLAVHAYDALVTDLDMPELDGLGLIERVRGTETGAALPIVIITARATPANAARAAGLEVREVLEKPVSADRLLAALAGR